MRPDPSITGPSGPWSPGPPTSPGTFWVEHNGKQRMVSVFESEDELKAWVYDDMGQLVAESSLSAWPESCRHREVE